MREGKEGKAGLLGTGRLGTMPITHDIDIRQISKDDYHALDYEIMEAVFDARKTLLKE